MAQCILSATDQLNIAARFVSNDGSVEERLLGLEVITSDKGVDLQKLCLGKLEKLWLDVHELHVLSLDGASANTSKEVRIVKYYNKAVPKE